MKIKAMLFLASLLMGCDTLAPPASRDIVPIEHSLRASGDTLLTCSDGYMLLTGTFNVFDLEIRASGNGSITAGGKKDLVKFRNDWYSYGPFFAEDTVRVDIDCGCVIVSGLQEVER